MRRGASILAAIVIGAAPLPALRAAEPADIAIKNLTFDFTWRKTGFGLIMEADFKIRNSNAFAVKDLQISCTLSGKSGTPIGTVKKTIYDVVRAGSTKRFPKIGMGFIDSQADSASCSIIGVATVDRPAVR